MCMQDFDHNGGQMDSKCYLLGNVTEMRQTVILVVILSLDHIILITAYMLRIQESYLWVILSPFVHSSKSKLPTQLWQALTQPITSKIDNRLL